MKASLKSTRGPLREINQIKSKISVLQDQYQELLTQRQQDIASFIATLDLTHIDDAMLIGGLIFLKDKIALKDSIMESWHNAGDRFLRQNKTKKRNISKTNTTTQPTDQSPQKQSQSREKQDEKAATNRS